MYRYQKKIGTYDKQPWEQTVEHRILSGFVNTPSKNVAARTEYIDVDLVRGLYIFIFYYWLVTISKNAHLILIHLYMY